MGLRLVPRVAMLAVLGLLGASCAPKQPPASSASPSPAQPPSPPAAAGAEATPAKPEGQPAEDDKEKPKPPIIFETYLSLLPAELRTARAVYQERVQHMFGPGGINQSITIYDLPEDIVSRVADSGLEWLNGLPSNEATRSRDLGANPFREGPYWRPFWQWRSTPIAKDDEWIRRSYVTSDGPSPSLTDFFADKKFLAKIPKDVADEFHEAVSSESAFYTYGGYRDICVIIIVPSKRRMYFLFRD